MKNSISYSPYVMTTLTNIEKLKKTLETNKENRRNEHKKILTSKIIKITELKETFLSNIKIKYFEIALEVERPKKGTIETSIKNSKILFFKTDVGNEVHMLVKNLEGIRPHLILKGIFEGKDIFNSSWNGIIRHKEFNFFLSWLFNFTLKENPNEKTIKTSNNVAFLLKDIQNYKYKNDDRRASFKGTSNSGVANCAETIYAVIKDNNINYTKIKIQYGSSNFDFTISSSEEDDFKLYYHPEDFDNKIFNDSTNLNELLIFLNIKILPELKTAFEERGWNEDEHIDFQLLLLDILNKEILKQKEFLIKRKNNNNKTKKTNSNFFKPLTLRSRA